jgi:hypothetical protein
MELEMEMEEVRGEGDEDEEEGVRGDGEGQGGGHNAKMTRSLELPPRHGMAAAGPGHGRLGVRPRSGRRGRTRQSNHRFHLHPRSCSSGRLQAHRMRPTFRRRTACLLASRGEGCCPGLEPASNRCCLLDLLGQLQVLASGVWSLLHPPRPSLC